MIKKIIKKVKFIAKMLATLYGANVATINEHISNIYKNNELEKDSTIRNFLIVQKYKDKNKEI